MIVLDSWSEALPFVCSIVDIWPACRVLRTVVYRFDKCARRAVGTTGTAPIRLDRSAMPQATAIAAGRKETEQPRTIPKNKHEMKTHFRLLPICKTFYTHSSLKVFFFVQMLNIFVRTTERWPRKTAYTCGTLAAQQYRRRYFRLKHLFRHEIVAVATKLVCTVLCVDFCSVFVIAYCAYRRHTQPTHNPKLIPARARANRRSTGEKQPAQHINASANTTRSPTIPCCVRANINQKCARNHSNISME